MTMPTVRIPRSWAVSATTGAAPVPVPPPMPAVIKVKALLRIAVVYDIPIANNLATADFMLHSKYMNESYSRQIENFDKKVQNRVEEMK